MDLTLLKGKLMKKGGQCDLDSLCDTAQIGLYFSAHWCPPCRGFTPVLIEYYNKRVAKDTNGLEIIFVTSDQDQESFNGYYESMPWATVKFDDKETIAKIKESFSVRGIPTLIILDKSGKVVTSDGRGQVDKHLPRFECNN